MDDLRTPVGADMFDAYDKDPGTDTDAEVTVAEMATGYETAPGFTDPVFYESIVTVSRFEQNQLAELRLYPIELGHSKRLANRGIPRLAPLPQAKSILERLPKLQSRLKLRSPSRTASELSGSKDRDNIARLGPCPSA
ncbi:hypothetical protein ACVJBD_007524 [Rhizobium mongolense]